jgi:L-arabinose isomerase
MNMINLANPEIWLVCGSQHLYGPGPLKQVAANAQQIADALATSKKLPLKTVFKALLTTPDEITKLCLEANSDPNCAGLILWMHTFSPSKMWIRGLNVLQKPFAHLHTQFNAELPWDTIDMDFMNLNQAAHGDREAGFIHTRMRLARKVVVGHWADPEVHDRLGAWMRATRAWHDWQGGKFCRFGDNMRQVAVTDGDKVSAEMQFGFSTNTWAIGDLVAEINKVSDAAAADLVAEYEKIYAVVSALRKGGNRYEELLYGAKQELGLRAFLEAGGFKGFTDTFEDLYGLRQLPGLASQRLMADGYGFAGEGDWKTVALVRAMMVMADGLPGGTSFMEDYTYSLPQGGRGQVLGSHMLEVSPSIASGKPTLEVHPLGIGGKEDPVRLVFDAAPGPALNASLIDLGNRFRLVVNEVDVVKHPKLPKLPVARAVWECRPDHKSACAAWILGGGAHHSSFSYAVTAEMLEDFAAIAGIELALIGADTKLSAFKQDLRSNEVYYHLAKGFRA